MDNQFEYKVIWCPVCNQGWVEIVKDKETQKLFLCCSECETEWLDPSNIKNDNGTQDNFGQAVNPSIDEIKNKKWDLFMNCK